MQIFFFQEDFDGKGHGLNAWTVSVVPIPGAIWMLGSGLLGLIGIQRKKQDT